MASVDERVRCFVAVELPAEARRCIGGLVAGLREAGVRGLRPVNPDGVHLTLKFLGDVSTSTVGDVAAALEGAAAGARPFDLELRGVGGFPDLRRPRVLWVGVGGDLEALQRLYESVESALAPLGFPPEGRAFTPHLTLARLREGDVAGGARSGGSGADVAGVGGGSGDAGGGREPDAQHAGAGGSGVPAAAVGGVGGGGA